MTSGAHHRLVPATKEGWLLISLLVWFQAGCNYLDLICPLLTHIAQPGILWEIYLTLLVQRKSNSEVAQLADLELPLNQDIEGLKVTVQQASFVVEEVQGKGHVHDHLKGVFGRQRAQILVVAFLEYGAQRSSAHFEGQCVDTLVIGDNAAESHDIGMLQFAEMAEWTISCMCNLRGISGGV